VDVFFTVTDKKGKSIRNLKQEHFKVYEDSQPQVITNFSAEGNLPLTIALLIDTSGSVRDMLPFEQAAAIQFFESTLVRKKDRAVVIAFDTDVKVMQDYTDDTEALSRGIRRVQSGGSTSLYDAVRLAVTRKLAGQDGRKIMVMITDGDDTASRSTLSDALDAAQRHEVIIYAVSTNSPGLGGAKSKKGDDTLKKFAEATGGRVFNPSKIENLSSNFSEITDELRFQYGLAYSSTNPQRDGAFRRIRIEPSNKQYVVRARTGYFAPPAGASR
jgi:VWFA-related protein